MRKQHNMRPGQPIPPVASAALTHARRKAITSHYGQRSILSMTGLADKKPDALAEGDGTQHRPSTVVA